MRCAGGVIKSFEKIIGVVCVYGEVFFQCFLHMEGKMGCGFQACESSEMEYWTEKYLMLDFIP